jgi:dolichol kinase
MDVWANLPAMLACYGYIVALIIVAGRLKTHPSVPRGASRKFLHAMIGNLPFIMPYFTDSLFPFLVASPFVAVTYLVSPYSPWPGFATRMRGLSDITEEGHGTGLILYAVSYSALALVYGTRPHIVAAGVLPMAYGDSVAALVGASHGRHRFRVLEWKSLEGCLGMFAGSLLSLLTGMAYFSMIYEFSLQAQVLPVLVTSMVVTAAEAASPRGLDNVTVPALGALTFIVMGGGV